MPLNIPADLAPFVTVAGTLAGAFGGAYFGQRLARGAEAARSKRRDRALLASLISEVHRCAALAETYMTDGVQSPVYRLPRHIHDAAMPTLAGSVLSSS